jgi:Uma2 family endonuclease
MALATQVSQYIAPEEYLRREKEAERKSEYFAGEIFMMSGGSPNHNRISGNVYAELNVRLRGTRCEAFNSDQRVLVKKNGLYTYPDVMVVCGPTVFDERDGDTITNPVLIVEVLSPSTENYDRGKKFELYREIETLRDYLVIHQEKVYIEYYHKGEDDRWVLTEIRDLEATFSLETLSLDLSLQRIYERVDWTAQ